MSSTERTRAWRERQKADAKADVSLETASDQVDSEDEELERIAELEGKLAAAQDEAAAQAVALTAAREEAAAVRTALASAQAETSALVTQLAAAQEEAADLRTQAAVTAATHAGELAAAQAVADERQRQIDTLRADLAEAHKAGNGAGQVPTKRVRHYTSAERFDPDVLHQEVLQKWFKYADEHPNPVPPEERLRATVREILAASKAKEAVVLAQADKAQPEAQETPPHAPDDRVVVVEAVPGRRGLLHRRTSA